jgi:hypothetical protein
VSQNSKLQPRVRPLADDFVKVYESPNPQRIFTYSPGIALLSNGRLIATLDISGPGIADIPGPKNVAEGGREWQGKVFVSDDKGQTWQHRCDFPFMHARPFEAGNSVYVLGQADNLMIIRSDDNGETWSPPVQLTDDERISTIKPNLGTVWHQAPANVHYAHGCVYLVMEKRVYLDISGWNVNGMAPILMRGRISSDLTKRENWTFASTLAFRDAVDVDKLDYFGVPFFDDDKDPTAAKTRRRSAPIGWLETNVVQFKDPNHIWYDPKQKTFHLWARTHTGGTGYAAIAKVEENDDGSMTTMLETAPSGRKVLYVPCPGGQMKFHILYDEVQQLFWLLSSQATDSMTRRECLPEDRFGLPNNERHRLQLHFSRNCIDWCFAGIVSIGGSPRQARHYASMVIDGDDLYVLSRSGG